MLDGIAAAQEAGLKVKINTVALKRDNARDLPDIIRWAHDCGMDITLIETMPLGAVDEDRTDQFLSLTAVRQELESYWTLTDLPDRTRRTGALCARRRDRRQAGFHHAADPQFLRKLPPRAGDLHRHLVHVPGPGRFGGFARTAARLARMTVCCNAAIDRAMAAKPKAHDFLLPVRGAPRRRSTGICPSPADDGRPNLRPDR